MRDDKDRFGGVPGHVWVAQQRLKTDNDYREAICDWLRANDINPDVVPADARASIANGQLTIPLKVQTASGHDQIDPSDDTRMLTHTVTARWCLLTASPSESGCGPRPTACAWP